MADITQTCTQCGKKYLIITQEQEFLKKKGLPNPSLCPADRQLKRLARRGERTLYKTTCQKCGKQTITSYDPTTATSPIYCKTCFQEYFDTHEIVQS